MAEQRRLRVRVEFKKEDCWVGVFWRTERTTRGLLTTWWVCLLPMLPIVVQWATDVPRPKRCRFNYTNGRDCELPDGHEGNHRTLFGDGGGDEGQAYWSSHWADTHA